MTPGRSSRRHIGIVRTRRQDFKPLRRLNFPIVASAIFDQLTGSTAVEFVPLDRTDPHRSALLH
jgi:hypothetical protein